MDYILSHHGIKGQKWGVRRFQNADGTRTAAGKKRYKTNAISAGAKYAESTRRAMNPNLSSEQRKSAKKQMKADRQNLETEKAKMRYNDTVDRGKDPTRFNQGRVNRYMKKGMSRSDAELKAFQKKESFNTGVKVGVVSSAVKTAAVMGLGVTNPAVGVAIGAGSALAVAGLQSVGRDKIYDRQLRKEM